MIKYLNFSSKHFILHFFNRIYNEQVFPIEWREALVIPIAKPNGNRLLPEGYRPISLTNCLCKILEKIINRRLIWYLESNEMFFNHQFGFRKYRSTTDNIAILETDIHVAFSRTESVVGILLDLEQAYNKSWRLNIIKTCISLDIKGNLLKFIG